MKKFFQKEKGITLIALIVTIIILIILTAITIGNVMENNLFGLAKGAAENYVDEEKKEQEVINGIISNLTNGEKNEEKANAPKLTDGMIPVKYDVTKKVWVMCTRDDPEWYSYTKEDKKWANVMLSDGTYKTLKVGQEVAEEDLGSMFVWIPRYAYKIVSGYGSSESGKIEIVFLNGVSDEYYDENGRIQIAKREIDDNVEVGGKYENYVVHPVFRDGDAPGYEVKDSEGNIVKFGNGEWDEELSGFWIAKFPAGLQQNRITDTGGILSTTISNSSDAVFYLDKYYSSYYVSYDNSPAPKNALGQDISITNYMNEKLSYPVFKPLTFVYDMIGVGDCFAIAQDIAKANSFYGLNSKQVDSHLMKNSEWGAVSYLTQSQYGRDGEELNINNYWMTNNIAASRQVSITGIYANGVSNTVTDDITSMNPYYTEIGVKGSSTGNITGIYDLTGCVHEKIAAYIPNENEVINQRGRSFFATTQNEKAYLNSSTKYITAYPSNLTNSNSLYKITEPIIYGYEENMRNNHILYRTKKSNTYGYGDAIIETSDDYNAFVSWNGDGSGYPYLDMPFFIRGGRQEDNSWTGIFSSWADAGDPFQHHGFRVVLVSL